MTEEVDNAVDHPAIDLRLVQYAPLDTATRSNFYLYQLFEARSRNVQ